MLVTGQHESDGSRLAMPTGQCPESALRLYSDNACSKVRAAGPAGPKLACSLPYQDTDRYHITKKHPKAREGIGACCCHARHLSVDRRTWWVSMRCSETKAQGTSKRFKFKPTQPTCQSFRPASALVAPYFYEMRLHPSQDCMPLITTTMRD